MSAFPWDGRTWPSRRCACSPPAWTGDGWPAFRTVETERLAWGFSHLFDDVKHSDYRPLRREIEAYFGSRFVYYRYHRGFNKLYEEEQQWIDGLFRRYGYNAPRVYDNYRTSWKY
ncbi:DUF6078 family protein [Prevotella multiformis]|uniref:DUF6078 family protein n=1 Tax=Prevotella multiformis TaxID=282402 RepID=UPI0021D430C2